MSTYRPSDVDQCLPWADLVQALEEGRSLPAEHLRECRFCRQRSEFIAALPAAGARSSPQESRTRDLGDPCPDVADWAALADGNVGVGARARLVEHLAGCETCAALWRHLVDTGNVAHTVWEVHESPGAARMISYAPEVDAGNRPLPRWVKQVAVAAAAMLAFFVLVADPFPRIGPGNEGRWRGPVTRLTVNVQWDADGVRPTLHWNPYPEASAYRVRIWDGSGEQLVDGDLVADGSPQYPIDLPATGTGRPIIWQVDALKAGRVLATAGPTELRRRAP